MPFTDGLPSGTEQGALSPHHERRLAPRAGAGRKAAGPDIGWALACGGLLLAAAILGLTADNRRAASRTSLGATLRPLIGRR
jgi:hypothetical protein